MKKKKGLRASSIDLPYILPRLAGSLLSRVHSFAPSLYYSFTNYDLLNGVARTGSLNYEKIFTDEDITRISMVIFKYTTFDVPLKLAFTLPIAYILNSKLRSVSFFRTVYYIPFILSDSTATAILWKAVFNTNGLISMVITSPGGPKASWMTDVSGALFVTAPLRVWQPGFAVAIFLTVLENVSEDLCEAASIDGAGEWTQFFKITIPPITPVISYSLITQLCQASQEFNAPFLVTKDGPDGTVTLTSMLIYSNVFLRHKMGTASAQAWTLFLTIMTLTAVVFISQEKWVYYSDEGGK